MLLMYTVLVNETDIVSLTCYFHIKGSMECEKMNKLNKLSCSSAIQSGEIIRKGTEGG